jgi:peptide/nickel transport system permease protein
MLAYLIRRVLQGIFVLLVVVIFTFTLSYLQPHGAKAPAYLLCGTHQSPSCINSYVMKLGLDRPYFVRLGDYLWGVLTRFDLGYSYKENQSVVSILTVYIPRTFWLGFFSLLFATLIAVPLGILQAWRRNSGFDYAATGVAFVLYSIPAYVLGFVLFQVFSLNTLQLPTPSDLPSGVDAWAIFKYPQAFILPIVTLTALSVAGLSRFMRSQVLDVLVQDYVRMARAKGCGTWGILFKHTMRNALGPIVVIIGLSIPVLLSGALIVENVFNYGGIGVKTIDAANNVDVYLILGITIVVTIATIIGNILADVGLAVLNPRVRIEGSAK